VFTLLLGQAADTFSGDIFAIIHRGNRPSLNVARKLGFAFSKPILFAGEPRDLYRIGLNGPAGRFSVRGSRSRSGSSHCALKPHPPLTSHAPGRPNRVVAAP
jgi:hypothetical protein